MMNQWSEGERPDMNARWIKGQITIMSIGPEGLKWLNENAPQWQEWVDARTFTCRQIVDERIMRASEGEVLEMVRDNIARQIAKELVRGMEDFRRIP